MRGLLLPHFAMIDHAPGALEPEPLSSQSAAMPKSGWLAVPLPLAVVVVLSLLVLAAPAWLFWDDLHHFALAGDDFTYITNSLDAKTCWSNLLLPHNTHVVPLFRLWTFALVAVSGDLARMPLVFGAASYLGLMVVMAVTGHFVSRETGSLVLGLVVTALVGTTTVLRSTVSWFSAGQALWAGSAIMLTLLAARAWALRGGLGRLTLIGLGAIGAAAFWSGGLMAAPAAAAYLVVKRPKRGTRMACLFLGLVTLASGLVVVLSSRNTIANDPVIWERHHGLWPRPIQMVFHSIQATVEKVVLGGLGLDALTSDWQAVLLLTGLVSVWAWSRGSPRRINPLEATGAVIVAGSYLLVYFFRGNMSFDSLRPVDWYNAVPYLGATLFVAGWWVGLRGEKAAPRGRLTIAQGLVVLGASGAMLVLHAPRTQRTLFHDAPAMSASEEDLFQGEELLRYRAVYFKTSHQQRQVRALARLDKANQFVGGMGVGRTALRGVFGRLDFPGIPEKQRHTDPFSLLHLPPDDPRAPINPSKVRDELGPFVRPEPEERPPWIKREEKWPVRR